MLYPFPLWFIITAPFAITMIAGWISYKDRSPRAFGFGGLIVGWFTSWTWFDELGVGWALLPASIATVLFLKGMLTKGSEEDLTDDKWHIAAAFVGLLGKLIIGLFPMLGGVLDGNTVPILLVVVILVLVTIMIVQHQRKKAQHGGARETARRIRDSAVASIQARMPDSTREDPKNN